MICTSQLSYSYEGGQQLSFADIEIQQGVHTLIIGASGCGKTTLLHLLAGLRKPTSGSITILDKEITAMSSSDIDKFRGSNMGMIFQVPHFLRSLDVIENITLAQTLAGQDAQPDKVMSLLSDLNLEGKGNKKTNQLSLGEQQRVAILRAMVNEPKIIFADEPTSALDDANTEQVIELLKNQADKYGATLIVVTHDQRLKDNFNNMISL